jgi:hypothetical protein
MKTKTPTTLKKIGHAAALMFGSYWLVATSATNTPVPPRECFMGIADPATLRVVLGPTKPASQSSFPSCAGLDGVAPGGTLTFTVAKSTSVPTKQDGSCFTRDTQALEGVQGLTLSLGGVVTGFKELTQAWGDFASTRAPGCKGGWFLELAPEVQPALGKTISPLDAGAQQAWIVKRNIAIADTAQCGAEVAMQGAFGCEDDFTVSSITEVAP